MNKTPESKPTVKTENWPLWVLTYIIVIGSGWLAYEKDLISGELVTAVLMAIIGFHYGSSYGSMIKSQALTKPPQ